MGYACLATTSKRAFTRAVLHKRRMARIFRDFFSINRHLPLYAFDIPQPSTCISNCVVANSPPRSSRVSFPIERPPLGRRVGLHPTLPSVDGQCAKLIYARHAHFESRQLRSANYIGITTRCAATATIPVAGQSMMAVSGAWFRLISPAIKGVYVDAGAANVAAKGGGFREKFSCIKALCGGFRLPRRLSFS